ncbi:MAG: glycosyltransferase family 2 protein [Elusimicrobia bacterium]|nr:glycosyltransferase family 2 protein [Elusimicrobiota bacterium]
MNNPELSIVIPCYNESKRIGATLRTIDAFLHEKGIVSEIIAVDDGSSDNTVEVLRKTDIGTPVKIISFKENQGKGAAVKRGMFAASGSLVLFSDADLSTPIDEYLRLKDALLSGNYHIAIASRGLPGSNKEVPQGFFRDRMGKLFGYMVGFILLPGIHDSQCGFKLFKKECIHDIFTWQTILGFGFDPEILYIARKQGYKIIEVPVTWRNNFDTKLHPLIDTFFIGFELFKIKVKVLLKHYQI